MLMPLTYHLYLLSLQYQNNNTNINNIHMKANRMRKMIEKKFSMDYHTRIQMSVLYVILAYIIFQVYMGIIN